MADNRHRVENGQLVGDWIVGGIDVHEATRLYFSRILRAALMLSGNPWDADDLAQETFLVAARQQDKFGGRSSVYTWLYGILLNLERRHRRRLGTHQRKLQMLRDQDQHAPPVVPPAECSIEVKEWKDSLWSHVAQLPDGQRQALVLRFSEGLQYDEIAEILECPLGTVKSRIFHALAALRRSLDRRQEIRERPRFPREDVDHAI